MGFNLFGMFGKSGKVGGVYNSIKGMGKFGEEAGKKADAQATIVARDMSGTKFSAMNGSGITNTSGISMTTGGTGISAAKKVDLSSARSLGDNLFVEGPKSGGVITPIKNDAYSSEGITNFRNKRGGVIPRVLEDETINSKSSRSGFNWKDWAKIGAVGVGGIAIAGLGIGALVAGSNENQWQNGR